MGSNRRRVLNQSTHSRVAYSTVSKLRQSPRRWMTSALNRPLIVSARALSWEAPTLPTDGAILASASRSSMKATGSLTSSSHAALRCSKPSARRLRALGGEYLFVVLRMMLHPTQVLEPPANPGRFTAYLAGFAAERRHQSVSEGLRSNEADKTLVLRNRIKKHSGKDRIVRVNYKTDTTGIKFRRILLPVWILHYEWDGKP